MIHFIYLFIFYLEEKGSDPKKAAFTPLRKLQRKISVFISDAIEEKFPSIADPKGKSFKSLELAEKDNILGMVHEFVKEVFHNCLPLILSVATVFKPSLYD